MKISKMVVACNGPAKRKEASRPAKALQVAKRSRKEVAEVAYKLTLRSPAVERYMHDDPHCDNLEDIFGDLAVTAMLVPLKRV